jgi:hypothetical protein
MRPISRTFLVAMMAFGATTAAQAETTSNSSVLSPKILSVVSDLQLDGAFEQAMSHAADQALLPLGGPSSMVCSEGAISGSPETCVVSIEAARVTTPASLAQR